ncbi:MAG: DUF3108 domain-containing protein [Calditrichia bacterium]
MNTRWNIRISLVALLLLTSFSLKGEELKPNLALRVGEELNYKVKYSIMTLGSLNFKILGRDTLHGRPVYHCILYINSDVPFVTIHDIYESWMDEEIYSHRFFAYERKKNYTLFTSYDIDYNKKEIRIIEKKMTESDTVITLDSIAVINTDRKIQDGLTILFYARAMAKYKKKMSVPVFVFNELKYTFINFTGERKQVKAKGKKYKAFYLDGWLKFVGIAGIKEGFKGWFSPDAQSIPLRAHMEAFIGHVTIQLDSWNNWEPEMSYGEVSTSGEN